MLIIRVFAAKYLALTFPAPVGVQKILVFCANSQICGLITLLLDIGSLARGAKMAFTSPDFDQKMAKKTTKKRAILGIFPGGAKKGHFWGGGLSPRGGQKGGFCLSNLHSFWPKRQIWSKRAIFWNFGHFGGFWGFWGVWGGPKSGQNGQNRGFLGFLGGSKKGQNWHSRGKSPITFLKKTGKLKSQFCRFLIILNIKFV